MSRRWNMFPLKSRFGRIQNGFSALMGVNVCFQPGLYVQAVLRRRGGRLVTRRLYATCDGAVCAGREKPVAPQRPYVNLFGRGLFRCSVCVCMPSPAHLVKPVDVSAPQADVISGVHSHGLCQARLLDCPDRFPAGSSAAGRSVLRGM